ncbi:MAG: uncharacterized protein A8A55_2031, partial [Amphiamblys sp. WSBS2006]
DESEDGVFLFPLCQEAHHHACLECLDVAVKDKQELICPICREEGDRFGMDEYKKAIGQSEEGLSALITQYQTPDSFSLIQDLPNETLLLTEKTTVILSNIEISEKLFFVLLEKTRVAIGERFSITEHVESEECIREHGMAKNSLFCLEKTGGVTSSLTLENIERIPQNSIGCVLKEFDLHDTGFINILPKLRINEDSKFKLLGLSAIEKEHVSVILSQNKPFCVGSVDNMTLENYAVSILPKLRIHENSEIELLKLAATEKEHVAIIFSQDHPFCVERVKNITLDNYAVSVLTKLGIHENSEVELLDLYADEKEHISLILSQDHPFFVGRVKNITLEEYAVGVLPKLRVHENSKVELLWLVASEKEHVDIILSQEQMFFIGRVKNITLEEYAVSILTKMRIYEDCDVEVLVLNATEKEHVDAILSQNQSFCVGRVKNMRVRDYAACILPKQRIHKDCEVGFLRLATNKEEHIAEILSQDQPFCVGRVKEMEFCDYAVFVFLQTKKTRESLESLMLSISGDELWRKIHEELGKESITICIEKIKKLILKEYAVNVLPVLKTKREMDMFVLDANNEDQVSEVLAEEYRGVCFDRIKEFILSGSAVNLLPKMRIGEDCEVERLHQKKDKFQKYSKKRIEASLQEG